MTASKSLPPQPSLESLRKQAKKLTREVAAGSDAALVRVRTQIPAAELPLSLRNAQLVLAREHGFPGWEDLTAEVLKRMDRGLEWAASQAQRVIHDRDAERLGQLLAEYPALLSWKNDFGGTLLDYTGAFSDSFDAERERNYTRPNCAEVLLDAGAAVDSNLLENIFGSRSRGMLELLRQKQLLPRTLKTLAALGDVNAVREALDEMAGSSNELIAVNDACVCAGRFKQHAAAALLLDRCMELDGELSGRIAGAQSRAELIAYLGEHPQQLAHGTVDAMPASPWNAFVMNEVMRCVDAENAPAFVRLLHQEPFLLSSAGVRFQVEVIERCAFMNRDALLVQFLDLKPAILNHRPPSSCAIEYAIEYGNVRLLPLLMRIWPLPDDLPHAAATGDSPAVRRWFDNRGRPALGNLSNHSPANNPAKRANLHWGAATVQQVLDVALAWACINRQFEIATFLLDHGANINTDWATHEPASILHECAVHGRYDVAQFLIDHGIDLQLLDHRWNATAQGWAYNAANDMKMVELLEAAEQRREQ